jgi:hypothetical protein
MVVFRDIYTGAKHVSHIVQEDLNGSTGTNQRKVGFEECGKQRICISGLYRIVIFQNESFHIGIDSVFQIIRVFVFQHRFDNIDIQLLFNLVIYHLCQMLYGSVQIKGCKFCSQTGGFDAIFAEIPPDMHHVGRS